MRRKKLERLIRRIVDEYGRPGPQGPPGAAGIMGPPGECTCEGCTARNDGSPRAD